MKAFFNNQIVNEDQIQVSISDRAFCYGDGLFETVICQNAVSIYLRQHLSRLKKGMEVLQFEGWNSRLKEQLIQEQIEKLCRFNGAIEGLARVRIQVWREVGGLYTPNSRVFNLLITAHPTKSSAQLKELSVGFSQTVRIQYNNTSAYKTMSALPYVMAGLEKKQRKLDDLVLLSTRDHISECIASNLFWIKNGVIYTPSLRSGCVAGIRREFLIRDLRKKGFIVRRTLAKKATLLNADSLFNTNVAGIHLITQLEKKKFDTTKELREILQGYI